MKSLLKRIKKYRSYILTVVIIAVVAWYISAEWYQFALIQGGSMEPTYRSGQLVLLQKRYEQPVRNRVYAVRCDGLDTILIKRVVAVPGDTVWINQGVLYVNGISQNDLNASIGYAGVAEEPILLAQDEYFLLGDNVAESKDSRYAEVGCVNLGDFVGKVIPQK